MCIRDRLRYKGLFISDGIAHPIGDSQKGSNRREDVEQIFLDNHAREGSLVVIWAVNEDNDVAQDSPAIHHCSKGKLNRVTRTSLSEVFIAPTELCAEDIRWVKKHSQGGAPNWADSKPELAERARVNFVAAKRFGTTKSSIQMPVLAYITRMFLDKGHELLSDKPRVKFTAALSAPIGKSLTNTQGLIDLTDSGKRVLVVSA